MKYVVFEMYFAPVFSARRVLLLLGEPKFKYLTFINVMKMPLNKHGNKKTGKPQCTHSSHTQFHTLKKKKNKSNTAGQFIRLSFISIFFYCCCRRFCSTQSRNSKTCAHLGKDLGKCENLVADKTEKYFPVSQHKHLDNTWFRFCLRNLL